MKRRRPNSHSSSSRPNRPRRISGIKRLVLAILGLLLLGEAVLALLTSPWFYVRNTRVEGAESIPENEIVRDLQLDPRTNIFLVDKHNLRKRVLRNPVIEDVGIHRRLPGTLVVRTKERKAQVLLRVNDVLYEVDSKGVPFRVADAKKPGMLVIDYHPSLQIRLGKPIRSGLFDTAKDCLLIAKSTKNLGAIGITVDQNRDLCLNTPDGFRVILGRPEQLEEKLKYAAEAAGGMPGFRQRGEYINVMSLPNVFVKYRD